MRSVEHTRSDGAGARVASALAAAKAAPFWLDSPAAPDACDPLTGRDTCDLAVVGGGYTGLWTALLAKQAEPGRDVLLLEGRTVGWAASGRNGGFCAASLTHGLGNGMARWPAEMATLERLGRQNLDEIGDTVDRFGIDCGFERTGELDVATAEHQVEWLQEETELARSFGHDAVYLDQDEVRAEIDSPTYLGGSWTRDTVAMVDPAALAWGLKRACLELGVRIVENTPVERLQRAGHGVVLTTPSGTVLADQVALGTNVFPSLIKRLRALVIPVYDYALMTEPLSDGELASIGWRNRQGVGDVANQFHYYRLTHDNRILWGGYDAIYHYRNGMDARFDQRPATFEMLAEQFFTTFPQLDGLAFSHRWGGAVDTCSRFSAFQHTALGGRVAYSMGYTGLGVGATRFGARVMLDLLAGHSTEATELAMVGSHPTPFPPEPLRYAAIQLTRREIARSDRRQGRRGPWLSLLDRLGLGFDS